MVFRQSDVAAGPGQFGVIQAAAPSLGVDLRVADVRDAREIEHAVTTFLTSAAMGGKRDALSASEHSYKANSITADIPHYFT